MYRFAVGWGVERCQQTAVVVVVVAVAVLFISYQVFWERLQGRGETEMWRKSFDIFYGGVQSVKRHRPAYGSRSRFCLCQLSQEREGELNCRVAGPHYVTLTVLTGLG